MQNTKLWIVPVLAGIGLSTTGISAQEPGSAATPRTVQGIRLRTGEKAGKLPTTKSSDEGAVTIQKIVDFTTGAPSGLSAPSPSVATRYWMDAAGQNIDMPAVSMVFELEGEGYVVSVDGDDWKLIVGGEDVTEERLKQPEVAQLFTTSWRGSDDESEDSAETGEIAIVGQTDSRFGLFSTATQGDGRFPALSWGQRRNILDGSGDAVASVSRSGNGLNLRFLPRSKRAWLGVEVQPVTSALAEHLQIDADGTCLVSAVRKDSPAKKASIQVNDLIIRIDDDQVADSDSLIQLMAKRQPGEDVVVTVIRKGEVRAIPLKLGRAKQSYFLNTPRFDWTQVGTGLDATDFGHGMIQLEDITSTPFEGTIQGGADDGFKGVIRLDGEPFVIDSTKPKAFPGVKAGTDMEARLSEMEKTLADMRALMEKLLKTRGKKD